MMKTTKVASFVDVMTAYNLEAFKPAPGDQETLEEYQQWQSQDKRAEKVTITATLNDIFEDLREKLNNFLIHRYTKRKQQAHFFKLIDECDGSSIFLQVDFAENATIIHQDEIQSAHWSHQQVTIFTARAWINKDVKESFAIISNNLNHTKEAVYTFMLSLFEKITQLR